MRIVEKKIYISLFDNKRLTNKHLLRNLLVIAFLLAATLCDLYAQERKIDSLKNVIESAKHDSIKLNAMVGWSNLIYSTDPELDFRLNQQIDSICSHYLQGELSKKEETLYLNYLSLGLNAQGIYYQETGDLDKALELYMRSIEIKENLGDKMGVAGISINVGNISKQRGDFATALEYFYKSLLKLEELGHKRGLSVVTNNIGIIYEYQKEYDKAIEFYDKSLEIKRELDDKSGIATTLFNMGGLYDAQEETEKAMGLYNQSLTIYEEIDDKKGMAISLLNIGKSYYKLNDYTKTMDLCSRSLEIANEYSYRQVKVNILNLQSFVYFKEGKKDLSISHAEEALSLAKEIGNLDLIKKVSEHLYELYKASNRKGDALSMYELYIQSRDSLESDENQRGVIRQEFKYAYEKQAIADSIKAADEAKVKDALLNAEIAENKQRKQQSYFLYVGIAITLLFGLLIFNRLQLTQRQKKIIETQKKVVDDAYGQLGVKNQEILDSIKYAKRIQSAILPPDKIVKKYLDASFVLYLPKDIVAGDFYWFRNQEDKILFAAADCTGHGVPGAMVSVVCNNALNRSVREYGLTKPSEILNKTREIVLAEFEKSEEEVKDGMDIALCSLEGNVLEFAGAYNPLYLIRDGKLRETKADRWPIGKSMHQEVFTNHRIELKKNDVIYIFTDGIIDQFGGERGKKMKKENFKKQLLKIHELDMEEQKTQLTAHFTQWMGNNEQLDDVCVIGVKIT